MKYKILHVIPYFAPAWGYGGPVKIVWEIARLSVEEGHEVSIFTTNVSGEKGQYLPVGEEIRNKLRIIRFANGCKWVENLNIWSPVGFYKLLAKEISSYHIVFLHEYRTLLNLYAYRLVDKYKKPYFLFAYGTLPRGEGWKKWAKLLFDIFWGRKVLQNALGVFAQTENERQEYLHFGMPSSKIYNFPLMIDLREFKNLPTRISARKKFNLSPNDFVILYLGRIHKYKGIDLILEAVSRLKKMIPQLKLLIVGRDDGYLPMVKQLIIKKNINDYVKIKPPLYKEERLYAYSSADIFVLTPNFYEETSLAALEALACGTPVIITKQAEIPYLEDFGCGSIINYNLSELVDKIFRYYTNRDKSVLLSKKAKDLIKQKYNLDDLYNRFERIIIQLI